MDARLLAAAGLSELEEAAYMSLLSHQGQSMAEVVDALRVPARRARMVLASLEGMGLVSPSPTHPPRWLPAAPEVAVEALVLRRRAELERTRLAIDELSHRFRAGARARRPGSDLVQVISGADAVAQRLDQLTMTATEELLGLGKVPLIVPSEEFTENKLRLLQRGVRSRAVYELGGLASITAFLERVTPAGEQSRCAASLPMRLLIVDRRAALTPLQTDSWDEWLLVGPCPLLDALLIVFEVAWERAQRVTISIGQGDQASLDDLRPLSADERRVLMLMCSGLRDQAIADSLGMNVRSVERHVMRMMELLDARTRFQAGTLAAARGLLNTPVVANGSPREHA